MTKGLLVTGRVRGTIAALSTIGALALGGCGTNDTAAVVDGHRLTISGVSTAAAQVNQEFTPKTPLTTADALNLLIIAPTIINASAKAGHPQSSDAARTQFTKVKDPNQDSITLFQANSALQGFDQATTKDVLTQIAKLKVTLNPRFGTFDGTKPGIVTSQPAWIVKPSG